MFFTHIMFPTEKYDLYRYL